MGNFSLGFKALFRVWRDDEFASRVRELLADRTAISEPAPAPEKAVPSRSEALTLLATLQREARLVDFLQEPIAGYTDAQIGSAVRSVHKECAEIIARIFDLQPLRTEPEGAELTVPDGYDPARFRITGDIPERAPFRGKVRHPGWQARKVELPVWNGRMESALVVAPCEIEAGLSSTREV